MSDTKMYTEDFAAFIRRGDIRSGVAEVMGQNPIGIDRSKRLLLKFNQLDSVHQKLIMDWSCSRDESLPIGDQKWYVEVIARHEMAHIVVAKALGFSTSEVTLVLNSPDGSHQGTSVIKLDSQTTSLSEVSAYIDRRVIVLLAGYIAESDDASERMSCAHHISQKSTESDLQKALELIQIKSNMIPQPNTRDRILSSLALRSLAIVEANFSVISALAQRFADRVEFYQQCIGWTESDIDEQPEIKLIKESSELILKVIIKRLYPAYLFAM